MREQLDDRGDWESETKDRDVHTLEGLVKIEANDQHAFMYTLFIRPIKFIKF